jgi:hypothetical protein
MSDPVDQSNQTSKNHSIMDALWGAYEGTRDWFKGAAKTVGGWLDNPGESLSGLGKSIFGEGGLFSIAGNSLKGFYNDTRDSMLDLYSRLTGQGESGDIYFQERKTAGGSGSLQPWPGTPEHQGMEFKAWMQSKLQDGTWKEVKSRTDASVEYYERLIPDGAGNLLAERIRMDGNSPVRTLYFYEQIERDGPINTDVLRMQRLGYGTNDNGQGQWLYGESNRWDRSQGDTFTVENGKITYRHQNPDNFGYLSAPTEPVTPPIIQVAVGYYLNKDSENNPLPAVPGNSTNLEYVEIYDYLTGNAVAKIQFDDKTAVPIYIKLTEPVNPAHANRTPSQIEVDQLTTGWRNIAEGFHKYLQFPADGMTGNWNRTPQPWRREPWIAITMTGEL